MKKKLTLKEMGFPVIGCFTKIWNRVTDFDWYSSMFSPKRVRVADLIATQDTVELKGLIDCDPGLRIYVVSIAGKLYIRDGHHRSVCAKIRGQKTIPAFVLEL